MYPYPAVGGWRVSLLPILATLDFLQSQAVQYYRQEKYIQALMGEGESEKWQINKINVDKLFMK